MPYFLSSMASVSVLPSTSHHRSAVRPPPACPTVWGPDMLLLSPTPGSTPRCFCASVPPPPPPEFDSEQGKEEAAMVEKDSFGGDISTYRWCAGLGALGFFETSYLTYVKLFNIDAFCPVAANGVASGGACADVLNSDYAVLFGLPLPLFGMAAYGLVAALSLQLSKNVNASGASKTDLHYVLLGTTTAMATASTYFLYILNTKLVGAFCWYCLSSAALSFSLFLFILSDFSLQEIQKLLGLQLALVGLIVASLSSSYGSLESQVSGDLELDPFETEITTPSSPLAISLAKYLQSTGAKMYGAFWCSHCIEQKQMFGREAMKMVDYIECFPNGVGKGRSIKKECADVGIEGFPTWVIKGKALSGEKDLQALAEAAGFSPD